MKKPAFGVPSERDLCLGAVTFVNRLLRKDRDTSEGVAPASSPAHTMAAMLKAFRNPRLGKAVSSVLDAPAAAHSVASLACIAGMSRSTFAKEFSAYQKSKFGLFITSAGLRGRICNVAGPSVVPVVFRLTTVFVPSGLTNVGPASTSAATTSRPPRTS